MDWISAKGKMPPTRAGALVYMDWGEYKIGYIDTDHDTREWRWNFEGYNLYGEEMQSATHWMPLPYPPEEAAP